MEAQSKAEDAFMKLLVEFCELVGYKEKDGYLLVGCKKKKPRKTKKL